MCLLIYSFIYFEKKNLFSNHDLEGISQSAGSTSGRTNKVGEHLLSTCYVPGPITLFTTSQVILPSTLKKVVTFYLKGSVRV